MIVGGVSGALVCLGGAFAVSHSRSSSLLLFICLFSFSMFCGVFARILWVFLVFVVFWSFMVLAGTLAFLPIIVLWLGWPSFE